MDTGEGGLSPYHLEGNCDIIMQIGTAKYGIRNLDGSFSPEKARELARVVKAFEIRLSQGAKPGKGGVLPGAKVTAEIARIRGIPEGQDSISPNRHYNVANVTELLDKIAYVRELKREHVRIVQTAKQSVALDMLYPYPDGRRGAQARMAAGESVSSPVGAQRPRSAPEIRTATTPIVAPESLKFANYSPFRL